jgi:hypothetical protein
VLGNLQLLRALEVRLVLAARLREPGVERGEAVLRRAQRPAGAYPIDADGVSPKGLEPGDGLRGGGVGAVGRGRALHLPLELVRRIGHRQDLRLADGDRGRERVAAQAEPARCVRRAVEDLV